MANVSKRWWGLIAGVVALQALLLILDRVPGLQEPELVENRVLAKVPPLPNSIGELDRFRIGMDAYVADHFPPRRFLIAGLNYLRYLAGYSGTPRVVVGRDGWLFYDNGSHLSQLRPSDLTPSDVVAWVDTLEARSRALARRGITYVVVAPPVKERLYPERVPRWAGEGRDSADADVLAAASAQAKIENYVDLRAPLARARDAGVAIYSPFDTHWTGEGAYVAYVALMQALAMRGQPVAPRPRQDFVTLEVTRAARPQDLAHMLGIASMIEQTYPQLADPSLALTQRIKHLTPAIDWTSDRVVDTGREGPVLLLTGDSFSNAWLPLLSGHFSRVVFSHHQNGFFRDDLIDRFRPDIVLLEVIESGLRHAMQPAKTEGTVAVVAAPLSRWRAIAPLSNVETAVAPGGATYHCNLERMVADGRASQPVLDLEGWFADVARGEVGEAVELILQEGNSAWTLSAPITVTRSDVAQYFKNPALARSGFRIEADLAELSPGDYQVFLRMPAAEGKLVCITTRRFVWSPTVRTGEAPQHGSPQAAKGRARAG